MQVLILVSRYFFAILSVIFSVSMFDELRKQKRRYSDRISGFIPFFILLYGVILLTLIYRDYRIVLFGLLALMFIAAGYFLISRYFDLNCMTVYKAVIFLISLSLVQMRSLSSRFYIKQCVFVCMGVVIMIAVPMILKKIHTISNFHIICMVAADLLLLLMCLMGDKSFGAKISISVGPFSFQPIEFVKIAFVVFTIKMSEVKRGIVIGCINWLFIVLLLIKANDFGSILILSAVFVMMLFYATDKKYILWGSFILLCVCTPVLYMKVAHFRVRVKALLDPIGNVDDIGYQLSQSIFSIASGGIFGTGISRGLPGSIPLVEMDFMFSAIAEELGLIAALAILSVSFMLFYFLMEKSKIRSFGDPSHRFMAYAFAILYIFQVLLSIGGSARFLPSTGVVIPFVSYGGSAFVGSSVMFGVIFYIILQGRRGIYVAKR